MRHFPDGRQVAGEVELLGDGMLHRLRVVRCLGWFGPFMTDSCQQALTCSCFISPYQVHVHNRSKQPGYLTWLDAYRDEQALLSFGIVSKGRCPFWLCIKGTQILRR